MTPIVIDNQCRRSRASGNLTSYIYQRHWIPAFAGTRRLLLTQKRAHVAMVAPAQAGAQVAACSAFVSETWIPAFAGMTQAFPIALRLRLALLDACVTLLPRSCPSRPWSTPSIRTT